MASERIQWQGDDGDVQGRVMDALTRVVGHNPTVEELAAIRDVIDRVMEKGVGRADDDVEVFHCDGYSVRRLSPEESRQAGLEGYEPRIIARQHSTEEFLAFLNSIPVDDDFTPAARSTSDANT